MEAGYFIWFIVILAAANVAVYLLCLGAGLLPFTIDRTPAGAAFGVVYYSAILLWGLKILGVF